MIVANEDAVRSLNTGIDGFRAYYLVRAGDGGFTVSVFDEAAGGEESSKRAAEWIRENAADVNGGPAAGLVGRRRDLLLVRQNLPRTAEGP